mmetsp:Transcript_62987/g.135251  ORF Transcript_62987/g.135251 Transcript_62987/m.135251 type:complete len:228 (-) Transcript_62987:957-1640(-)
MKNAVFSSAVVTGSPLRARSISTCSSRSSGITWSISRKSGTPLRSSRFVISAKSSRIMLAIILKIAFRSAGCSLSNSSNSQRLMVWRSQMVCAVTVSAWWLTMPITAISPKAIPVSNSPTRMPRFSTDAMPCPKAYISLLSVPSLMMCWFWKKNFRRNLRLSASMNSAETVLNIICLRNMFMSKAMGTFSKRAAPISWNWIISLGKSDKYFMKIDLWSTCTRHTVFA